RSSADSAALRSTAFSSSPTKRPSVSGARCRAASAMARSRRIGWDSCSAATISSSLAPSWNAFSISAVPKPTSVRLRRLPSQQLVLERQPGLRRRQLQDVQLLDGAVRVTVVRVLQRDHALPAHYGEDRAFAGAGRAHHTGESFREARLLEGNGPHLSVGEAVGEGVLAGELDD